jgi:hypothetical protein
VRDVTRVDPTLQIGDGWFDTSGAGGAIRRQGANVETGWMTHSCQAGAPYRNGFIDWRDEITVEDLIAAIPQAAEEAVPQPELFVNPPGGVVNFGMWLAVSNSAPITLRLGHFDTGPWVVVTATITETAWDMGHDDSKTDDTFTCEGPGVVLTEDDPGWHSVEQGPCGFTDDWFSPDDEPFVIEATATWTVTDNTSDGRNGTSTPIARTDSLEYAVGEIQTVGESG